MDFIISTYNIDSDALEAAFLTCNVTPENLTFKDSNWVGTVISTPTPYVGLGPFSADDHIQLVVGDPLLPLDNTLLKDTTKKDSNSRTAQISAEWNNIFTNTPGNITPQHPSLLIRICRKTAKIEIITDPGSFITLYYHNNERGTLLSTSPDLIGALIRPPVDKIAIAERLVTGQISYPYTLYEGIQQIPPGSLISIINGETISSKWWHIPKQNSETSDATEKIAENIRTLGESFLNQILNNVGENGYISLSAGTDTRFLADLVSQNKKIKVACVTSTAVENLESWTARQVATALGFEFILHPRPVAQHAACVLPPPLLLSTQTNWEHAHFHLKGLGSLDDACFILGGYTADTFLANGDTYTTNRRKMLESERLEASTAEWATNIAVLKLSPEIKAEILSRRAHKLQLLELNSEVSETLANIWPFSQQLSKAHFDALRRSYPAYEFFMSTPMVEMGFKMSEPAKINPGKSTLLKPQNIELQKIPINPDSHLEVRKATRAFKKQYPRHLWPESIIFPGPWSEKKGVLNKKLDEIVAIAKEAVARRLGLNDVANELNGIHCYAAYTAIQISEGEIPSA